MDSLLIVVPTLDSCSLLPRLLSSLQHQSWQEWRILFVDGPSGADHRRWLVDCCNAENRCSWVEQRPDFPGIFGAMSQGFAAANPNDWVLFWGSDDWAATPDVLMSAVNSISETFHQPDLLVCRGLYVSATTQRPGRTAIFQPAGLYGSTQYRRALWSGFTPPHQATLFGPGARTKLDYYAKGFHLSADLNYFLQLSTHTSLRVKCIDLELVHMSDGGVSGQRTQRRLLEVCRAYQRAFALCWWFPFVARYIRRVATWFNRR